MASRLPDAPGSSPRRPERRLPSVLWTGAFGPRGGQRPARFAVPTALRRGTATPRAPQSKSLGQNPRKPSLSVINHERFGISRGPDVWQGPRGTQCSSRPLRQKAPRQNMTRFAVQFLQKMRRSVIAHRHLAMQGHSTCSSSLCFLLSNSGHAPLPI